MNPRTSSHTRPLHGLVTNPKWFARSYSMNLFTRVPPSQPYANLRSVDTFVKSSLSPTTNSLGVREVSWPVPTLGPCPLLLVKTRANLGPCPLLLVKTRANLSP